MIPLKVFLQHSEVNPRKNKGAFVHTVYVHLILLYPLTFMLRGHLSKTQIYDFEFTATCFQP